MNQKNDQLNTNRRQHFRWAGFLLAIPVLPVAVLSFWIIHGADNWLYGALGLNMSNALLLLLLYSVTKIVLGFGFGLFYMPRKMVGFNSFVPIIQASSKPSPFEVMRIMVESAFFGFLIGVGFLGIIDLLNIIVIQFLI